MAFVSNLFKPKAAPVPPALSSNPATDQSGGASILSQAPQAPPAFGSTPQKKRMGNTGGAQATSALGAAAAAQSPSNTATKTLLGQ